MANSNTVAMAPRALTGGGLGWSTTETIVRKNSDSSSACVVYMPMSGRMNGKKFRVHAHGHMTGGTTTNVTIALYKGTSTTVGSNTKIATTAATACNSASGTWELNWEGITDSTSDAWQARMNGQNNGTAVAWAAATANLASIDPVTASEGSLGFCVSGTFSAGDAGNVFVLDELSIEAL